MKIKIKNIALAILIVDVLLLIINIKYQDHIGSAISDLDYAKFFFYLGIVSFAIYLIIAKLKKAYTILATMAIFSFCISMFFNLRLAKDNYDRIQCNKGISEYFEIDSCEKIKNRFEEDLINGELKYFHLKYSSDVLLIETLRDLHNIEIIGMSCTMFTLMECYNNLVENHIKQMKS